MKKSNCLIIGAGLSGLACAITLKRAGLNVKVIEASSEVGGRVKTTKTNDGFLLDHGFQVLLNSYPELSNFVNLADLNLKKFKSGALVFSGNEVELLGNPFLHPETLLTKFFQNFVTVKDRALVVKLVALSQLTRFDFPMGETSTNQFLKDFGFSSSFIENFWRPFLTGVFLDSSLNAGSNYFKFLMRAFSLGQVSVPALGMSQLPITMAKQLAEDEILLNQPVKAWTEKSVILLSDEVLVADKVICAFDQKMKLANISKVKENPQGIPDSKMNSQDSNFHSVTTHYFSSVKLNDLVWAKWLVLVPQHLNFILDHMCIISSVSENYSSAAPLLSASVVGRKNYQLSDLLREINRIAKCDLDLHHVGTTEVLQALPNKIYEGPGFGEKDGVYYCGDHWASPSINGALKSGRLAAEKVLQDLHSDASPVPGY